MQKHLRQADHNEEFHQALCEKFPNEFFDWKCTVLFYQSLHYLQALAAKRGIDIGNTHVEIERNVRPDSTNSKMPISQGAWSYFRALRRHSHDSRYDGIITDPETFNHIMKEKHDKSLEALKGFKKYIVKMGVPLR